MSNFQPLEVEDRGSETQLQVAENCNTLTQQDKGLHGQHPENTKNWNNVTSMLGQFRIRWANVKPA